MNSMKLTLKLTMTIDDYLFGWVGWPPLGFGLGRLGTSVVPCPSGKAAVLTRKTGMV